MTLERPDFSKEPESYYYLANSQQVERLKEELHYHNFDVEEYVDLDTNIAGSLFVDENGYAVLIFTDIDSPDIYNIEVDTDLVNLVEGIVDGPQEDRGMNEILREAKSVAESIQDTPPDPNFYRKLAETHSKDEFEVWEQIDASQVEGLSKHLTQNYSEFRHLTKSDNPDVFPRNFEVFRQSGDKFIVITKMEETDTPDKYRVKATRKVSPVVRDFLGSQNAPPVFF